MRSKLIATWDSERKGVCWFRGDIIIVLLVIRGVDLNPGPNSGRLKLDQILAHMRRQESGSATVWLLLMMGYMQNNIDVAPLSIYLLGNAAAAVTTAVLNKCISVNRSVQITKLWSHKQTKMFSSHSCASYCFSNITSKWFTYYVSILYIRDSFIYLPINLSTYLLSVYQSTYPTIYTSLNLSNQISIYPANYLCIYPSNYLLSIYLSNYLYIYLPTYLPTYLSTYLPTYYLSIFLSVYLSIQQSFYLSIYLSNYIYIPNNTTDHIIYDCARLKEERDRLRAAVNKTEDWPTSKRNLLQRHYKEFSKFINYISFEELNAEWNQVLH